MRLPLLRHDDVSTHERPTEGIDSPRRAEVLEATLVDIEANRGVGMRLHSSFSRRRHCMSLAIAVIIVALTASPSAAQTFSSGSTGADGAFNPTCSPIPCTVSVPLPASGVFNFTTVNVPADVTVTFIPNAANTPVTMLASGDVTLAGRIDVSGKNGAGVLPGRGGPGGFAGGLGGRGGGTLSLDGTPGLGPGGGGGGVSVGVGDASGGGFGTAGSGDAGGSTYGLHTLVPLIGGSGGGGAAGTPSSTGSGGGGGGGAILIASSGTITLGTSGFITVPGGITAGGGIVGGGFADTIAGCGSGGGIRVVANRLAGTGFLDASGGGLTAGAGCNAFSRPALGGNGRIRLESFEDLTQIIQSFPTASRGIPGLIIPPTGFPTLRIVAIGGVASPDNPQGTFLATPDITLSPTVTNPVTVNLQATNVPTGTSVALSVASEGVPTRTTVITAPLSGSLSSSTSAASVTLPSGTSVIGASVTFATATAGLAHPIMIGGEEVKWIRVGASYGGGSTVTYITA